MATRSAGLVVGSATSADMFRSVAQLGPNRFADLTHAEWKATHLGVKPGQTFKPVRKPNAVAEFDYHEVKPSKTGVDWRKLGAVTEVKNQLQCGSCTPSPFH
jgi:xylem cysteine proteinase